MKFTQLTLILIATSFLVSCKPKLPDSFHMEKKYWDISDYSSAISQIKYHTPKEEGLPRLSDPLTAPVFNKLVDKQNVSVILEDDNLGLKYRDEVADKFWDASRDILKIYRVIDIQDKYVYPKELVKCIEFFLHTQLLYFKTGNLKILKETVDPNDPDVIRIVRSNQQTIVNNFNNNLDIIANEEAFTSEALNELALVINNYYSQLLKDNHESNYSEMKRTIILLIDNSESESVVRELKKLLSKIENVKK